MYAIVRQFEYQPRMLADAAPALAEIAQLHSRQPGYAGSVTVEDGRRLMVLNLWDSEYAAAASREAIGPRVQRLLEPLMAGASELIAAGAVQADDRAETMRR